MYPFSWITNLARKFMGNVTGLVEGERPVNPARVTKILKTLGFRNIHILGLTFNHVRFPCVIQNLINMVDYPLRKISPINFFSNSIGWFCEKP